MIQDLKVHQGQKQEQCEIVTAYLTLTQGLIEQGFDDKFIQNALALYTSIYTSPEGFVSYVEV
jgi:hypothetical protein